MELKFNNLLINALSLWPEMVDLSEIVRGDNKSELYSVAGLFPLSEKIITSCTISAEEILLNNLHDALYEVIHGVAIYTTKIRMSDLRCETICMKFERRLNNALHMPDLGYMAEDIQLINEYFIVNKK
ncbi:hypothetical protein QN360_06730 [Glaciimonas sp. CA11.2]|uniref:hypothetical protein n=1 Tax=Glaciimonas sp. CA11.2 TaxID=3048601 RepID=UPI002AB48005|nr:hypothetical protein [Glaciimonas sp. CA11.2]MDY7545857.1 hypothetical protein [Glaciimonas sp. CA11.2]MEB0162600.1 hypothetical protein [Glaciimonas sp. CA11.2]